MKSGEWLKQNGVALLAVVTNNGYDVSLEFNGKKNFTKSAAKVQDAIVALFADIKGKTKTVTGNNSTSKSVTCPADLDTSDIIDYVPGEQFNNDKKKNQSKKNDRKQK
jgi:hypothetical protein